MGIWAPRLGDGIQTICEGRVSEWLYMTVCWRNECGGDCWLIRPSRAQPTLMQRQWNAEFGWCEGGSVSAAFRDMTAIPFLRAAVVVMKGALQRQWNFLLVEEVLSVAYANVIRTLR